MATMLISSSIPAPVPFTIASIVPETAISGSSSAPPVRLSDVSGTMMRSPGLEKMCSLRKVETLSRPALVRVSAIITRPSRTRIPQQ